MKSPDPTFWPVSERITAIQTHTAQDATALKRKLEARRVAYSVRGAPLEVFHVNRSPFWLADPPAAARGGPTLLLISAAR